MRTLLPFAAGLLLLAACTATTGSAVQVMSSPVTPVVAGQQGSFDVVDIDQANHVLYAGDADRGIDVFNLSTVPARYVKSIPLPDIPKGLAIAPDLGRLFAATDAGSVAIVDIKPGSPTVNTVIKTVFTGDKTADLIDYSAAAGQTLFASTGVGGMITTIDASTGTVLTHISLGTPLEQPRF